MTALRGRRLSSNVRSKGICDLRLGDWALRCHDSPAAQSAFADRCTPNAAGESCARGAEFGRRTIFGTTLPRQWSTRAESSAQPPGGESWRHAPPFHFHLSIVDRQDHAALLVAAAPGAVPDFAGTAGLVAPSVVGVAAAVLPMGIRRLMPQPRQRTSLPRAVVGTARIRLHERLGHMIRMTSSLPLLLLT